MEIEVRRVLPRGFTAFGVFLLAGALIALLAAVTLLTPGTALDAIWRLNPRGYTTLRRAGKLPGVGFLFISGALALAGVGWFRRRRWGWALATAIIGAQVAANFANLFLDRVVEGVTGIVIASAVFWYLCRERTRSAFQSRL